MSTDPGSGPEADLVQVGSVEVDPADLDGPGSSLWDLLGDSRVEMRSPDAVFDLPRRGWRPLFPRGADATEAREVFAAPHGEVSDAWALVFVGDADGVRTVGAHPGPHRVHRCRAARRVGLELRWAGEHTCRAGALPGVTIELVNTADTTWVDEAGDRTTVHGWILDENGQRIVPGLFLFSDAPRLPDIAPGDRMYLRVNIVTRDVEDLPPGRYALVAELRDLALTSPLGALVLYASPPETA
ncbi:hypothetical protein [Prescottella equi]|uniref:hypothetical protein n=1 Tax=Rhodococcus hoagii TaxID=43767 RepID=UPI001C7731EE|nr:hypothetical protein [Prescottella equi]BCN82337.1 hypothetical protein RE0356_09780 [Prescottella equi]